MTTDNMPQGTTPNTIALMLGHPDPATLMPLELREAMMQMLSSPLAPIALQYGQEQGTPALIRVLVKKIQREQDVVIGPENVMIVAGSTHAVDMLARLYARPGGVVMVEAPTYVDALHIFRDQQIELCAIAMDEDGLIPEELERQVQRLQAQGASPSFLYTVPTFHNPTGRTLPEERRKEIIQLARRYGFLIVEDDVYRDLAFEGAVPGSFYALANGEGVLSIGSFSKTLAPGLRLGWLVGAEEHIERCVNCGVTQMGGGASPFVAEMVAQYCQGGHWERHILELRSLYKRRRDVALAALSRYMPEGVQWTHPAGGFFLWLHVPESVFAQDVKRMALERGVLVAAGGGFFVNTADGAHNLRLTYSCASPNDIEEGIKILAEVIEELAK